MMILRYGRARRGRPQRTKRWMTMETTAINERLACNALDAYLNDLRTARMPCLRCFHGPVTNAFPSPSSESTTTRFSTLTHHQH